MGRERGGAPTRAVPAAGRIEHLWRDLPPAGKLIALAAGGHLPLVVDRRYLMQVGIDTLIFVLLALGLNVAVGWVGLLDLGFVAFFAIGSYLYAPGTFGVRSRRASTGMRNDSHRGRVAARSVSSSGCRRVDSSATTSPS